MKAYKILKKLYSETYSVINNYNKANSQLKKFKKRMIKHL